MSDEEWTVLEQSMLLGSIDTFASYTYWMAAVKQAAFYSGTTAEQERCQWEGGLLWLDRLSYIIDQFLFIFISDALSGWRNKAQQFGITSPLWINCHNTGMRVSSIIWHFTSSREWFLLLQIKEWVSVSHALIARTWRFMTHVFISIPWSHSPHASWRSL